MLKHLRVVAVVAAFALILGACGGGDADVVESVTVGDDASDDAVSPGAVDGFELSDRIAGKIDAGEALNVVLSFQTLADVLAPALLTEGMERAAERLEVEHGVQINTRLIGPVETDPPAQISEVQTVVGADQADCLGIQPVSPDAFVDVFNEVVASGIPAFSVNTDSPDSARLAYYGLDELSAGQTAGEFTVDWMKDNGVEPARAALMTGDTTAVWAQDRMRGWVEVVTAAFPEMEVEGEPTNALTTSYDPAEIYSTAEAFLTGNPEVDLVFHTDWGAKTIGPLVTKQDRQGEVHVLGFNVDLDYLDAVANGDIIGTIDQGYDNQAEAFVDGCIAALLDGEIPDDPMQFLDPVPIFEGNLEEQREKFDAVFG